MNPSDLYEQFKDAMAEDFMRARHAFEVNEADRNKALLHMREVLHYKGRDLQRYGLPQPVEEAAEVAPEVRIIAQERALPEDRPGLALQATEDRNGMNQHQGELFDAIKEAVDANQPFVAFADAPGGGGKTFVGKALIKYVRSMGWIALPVAISGIAALLYPGGWTAHSRFKLPIKITAESTCNITNRTAAAQLLKEAKLIIWDEASMTHRYCPEALDRTLRDLMQNDAPFGGKVVLFMGDFRQVLAVVKRGSKAQIIAACLKQSHLWRHMHIFTLTINERIRRSGAANQAKQEWYAKWLLELGSGTLDERLGRYGEGVFKIPESMIVKGGEAELIARVFPGLADNYTTPGWLTGRAILTPKNVNVDIINTTIMSTIIPVSPADQIYLSADTVSDDDDGALHPTEFLNSLNVSGLPPHSLALKPDVPIMLLRNIDPRNGLCNGTILIVKELRQRVIQAVICSGHDNHIGTTVYLPRITLSPSDGDFPFTLQRRQFPIRVAVAMTINKSQGQTLKSVGIYLPDPVFGHGQAYVSASRSGDPDTVHICVIPVEDQQGVLFDDGATYTRNIVYKEVL